MSLTASLRNHRVDVVSQDYSYKIDKDLYNDWTWSEKFAPQPELMSYIEYVFKRWNLAPYVQFETTVKSATWNEKEAKWTVNVLHHPKGGKEESQTYKGRHLILASGCLSAPQQPKFAGLDEYKGNVYHTGMFEPIRFERSKCLLTAAIIGIAGYWPREGVDFTGQRVACIGTGSSAVQVGKSSLGRFIADGLENSDLTHAFPTDDPRHRPTMQRTRRLPTDPRLLCPGPQLQAHRRTSQGAESRL